MSASYTKLKSGEWGVRIEGTAQQGQQVIVKKKDGTTKTETITQIVWSGNGITLCAIGQTKAAYTPRAGGSGRSSRRGRRTGCSCGSIEDELNEGDCWSCRHDQE